ncbi:MAG TPA: Smr/MutS family protein [Myxococcota bacterium]|nr:Smr/MutS family protein [Myxococcota bacterium]
MGRRKNSGFNAPFAALKGRATTTVAGPPTARPRPTEPPAHTRVDTDAELFLRAVSGATPLPDAERRVLGPERALTPRPSDDELALAELRELVDGRGAFQVHESEEVLYGLAPGVNIALLQQLQAGHFAYHRHCDLHGLTRDDAHLEVGRFVAAARRDGERCVLVVTGRGKRSPEGFSVLRDALPRWLSRAPLRAHVLAFCTARAVDGGPGAFYVLLRRVGTRPYGADA